MRHRIKKIPTLSKLNHKFNHHLLHSDKSDKDTYFYKGKSKVATLFGFASRSTNDIRWTSRNRIPFGAVISTRSSRETTSYSGIGSQTLSSHISYRKMAGRANRLGNPRFSTIPLVLSAFGLLLVLGLSVGCVGRTSIISGSDNIAYAEGESKAVDEVVVLSDNASVSLSLADTANSGNMTITGDNKSIQEQVDTANNTGYIAVDFHVTATNIDKYDIYVQSSNSALIGETNGSKVESISSDTAYADMVNNTGWGYAVAEGSNVNAETLTYKPIQTSASSAVDSGSATNTTVNKDYTLAFAANLTGATADHYKSDITLSVAAGATQVMTLYSVTYNTNGSTGGTTPATQTAETNSPTYSFTTPEQNDLARDGYTFMGWADSPTAVFQQYAPGATITLSNTDSTKTLYAIWGKNYTLNYSAGDGGGALPASETFMLGHLPYTYQPTGSYANVFRVGYLANGWNEVTFTEANPNPTTTPTWTASNSSNFNTMQEIGTAGYCDAIGTTGRQLFDVRDGVKYPVAKLSDGKCWMTQNLRIVNKAITSADSDVTSDYTIPASSDPWSSSDGATTNKVHYANNTTYGAYYSWYTATAGTGGNITSTNSKDYPAEASGSICPKGWRLPTGNTTGEFQTLYNKGSAKVGDFTTGSNSGYWFGGTANASGAAFFPAGGYVYSGSLSNVGNGGRYWSSTAGSASQAYNLVFTSTTVNPSYNNARYCGYSIRCVAR